MAAPLWRRQVCYLAAEPGWWADIAATHFPDREATLTLMAELDLAPALLDAEIARLSTGERQRLSLIRGLLLRPKVYLLDEPTAGLDATAVARVEKVLRDRLAGGAGILLVTHDQEQARRLSTRRLVIENGRIGEETERVIEAEP